MSGDQGSDRMAAQVERAAKRLAQLQARRSLQEMRWATREKERARRAAVRRQMQIGSAVVEAGYGDAPLSEIVRMLGRAIASNKEAAGNPLGWAPSPILVACDRAAEA